MSGERESFAGARVTLAKIEITHVEVTIPAFCPYCGANLRGVAGGPETEPDGSAPENQWPIQLWVTTMGTQAARVGQGPTFPDRTPPKVERFPGEFDPGDEACMATGVECLSCLKTIATAAGLCAPLQEGTKAERDGTKWPEWLDQGITR